MIEPYKKIYTVKEAAEVLLVNSDTVRGFIRKGELIGLKLGALKIRGTDLEAFIEKYPAYNPEIMESSTEE
ncbi:helix-turn-helix domain-containing protein [Lacrimispora amygdalina]|uniref:helix-turn-helix domain-containing protein n=1 Tax=Lacrimispora amygdalina TaxID=253257 RepID=UPI000BE38B1A|nr:helix-turn-helix domain-containing protein [Lacrimispora amygdalina]